MTTRASHKQKAIEGTRAVLVVVAVSIGVLMLIGCNEFVESDDPDSSASDSCRYTNDGECDEGTYCAVGTDTADCSEERPPPTTPPVDRPGPVGPPRPVDIPITNIPQQTQVWCWAAVAQQIIAHAQGIQNTPAQCALVAIANNAAPGFCCRSPVPSPCVIPGSLQQIQALIAYFGGRYSTVAPPTDPVTLYRILQSGRPVIMSVQSPFTSIGHVVVIRGMTWVPTVGGHAPVLHVNDPLSYFTKPIPFANLARFWRQAIVVEAM